MAVQKKSTKGPFNGVGLGEFERGTLIGNCARNAY